MNTIMNVPVSIPTKPKLAICEICNKGYSDKSTLKKHLAYHSNEKPFICEVCDKGFHRKHDLNCHYRRHSSVKPFVCEICSKGFSDRTSLRRHIYVHTKEKPFICEVCNRGFSQKTSLNAHRYTHSSEKPFICEICEKGFCQKNDFMDHQRIHTNERPFICDVCSKGFFSKKILNNHLLFHSKEKPFLCEICSRGFCRKHDLTRHIRRHSEKKLLLQRHSQKKRSVFKVCSKDIKAQDGLNNHLHGHSGVEPEIKISEMPSTSSGVSESNAGTTVNPIVIIGTHQVASTLQKLTPMPSTSVGDGDTEISGNNTQRTAAWNVERKRKCSSTDQVRKLLVKQSMPAKDATDKKIIATQSNMHNDLQQTRILEKISENQEQLIKLQKDTNAKLDLLIQIVALGHNIKVIQNAE